MAPFSCNPPYIDDKPGCHNGILDPIPDATRDKPFRQYDTRTHANPRRKIIGSIMLSAIYNQSIPVEILHLFLEGSSQWVISRNATRSCNINHVDDIRL